MDKEAQDAYRSQLRKMGYLYLSLGWSIIPMHLSQKKPAVTWKDYQTTPASEEQVESWLEDGVPDGHGGLTKIFGWAVLTGKISGLVVLDCDNQDAINYALGEASLFSLLSTVQREVSTSIFGILTALRGCSAKSAARARNG